MSPLKSVLAGLAVGLITYGVVGHVGAIFPSRGDKATALIDTEVTPSLAPGAKEVPNRGTKSGTNLAPGAKTVSPSLALGAIKVAPSPVVSVTPHISSLITATASPAVSVMPRLSVTPNPTHTPSPTPSPTLSPTVSPTPTPTPSSSATPSVTPTSTVSPGTSHVVINEIAWAGTAANASDEWIELYNAGDAAVDVTGWALFESETKIITLSGSISPRSYYLVERTDDTTISSIPADTFGPFGGSGLKNLPDGEDLSLRDAGAIVVDSIPCSGGWFAGDAPTKATMERIDASQPGSILSNWDTNTDIITTGQDASGNPIHGTPKYKNSVTP